MTPGHANGNSSHSRIAIVTPWFGRDLRGGAEQQAWQLVQKLAGAGYYVDVLTTTSNSALDDWSRNHHGAGLTTKGRIGVRRFRVDARNRRAFEHVNAVLLGLRPEELRRSVSPVGAELEANFVRNNIGSRDLDEYLTKFGRRYASIIFIPYLYGTTLRGLPIVAERAYLQPCLHDESYAYLDVVEDVFRKARGLLFNSTGEFEFALARFGPGILEKSRVVGEGVEIGDVDDARPDRIGHVSAKRERFLLYLGRQDISKNVHSLVAAFAAFRKRRPTSRMKLFLAGERGARSFGDPAMGIVDLGPVSEDEKASLLAYCRALAQPSLNESYSRVMIEAWLHGRPVVVNGACLTTSTAVREARGGFLATTSEEWASTIARIDDLDDEALGRLGRDGNAYARSYAAWDRVIERYRSALAGSAPPRPTRLYRQEIPADDPDIQLYAESLSSALETVGIDAPVTGGVGVPTDVADGTIRHIRGGESALADFEASRRQIVVYHCDRHAIATPLGRVPSTAEREVFGSTGEAVDELRAAGFPNARLLPLYVDPRRWDRRPDAQLIAALQDRKTNLLYVGAFRELEPINELLTTFLHYLSLDLEARLSIVATRLVDESVFERIFAKVRSLDLMDSVLVAADLSEGQMQALYQTAGVFITLDKRDPVPADVLRAMWFDVPVIAYKTPAIERLVGSAGLMLTEKSDPFAIAALAQMVVEDRSLRERIVKAQRVVRASYGAERIAATFCECLGVTV